MYLQSKKLTYKLRDFLNVFRRLYWTEQVIYSDHIVVDYVLNTDTDRIYSPSY